MEKVLLGICGFTDAVVSLGLRRKIIEALCADKLTADSVKGLLDYAAYGGECNTACMLVMDSFWQELKAKELRSLTPGELSGGEE